jgi:hypothetical protein
MSLPTLLTALRLPATRSLFSRPDTIMKDPSPAVRVQTLLAQ